MLKIAFFSFSATMILLLAGSAAGSGREIPVVRNPEFIPASAAGFLEGDELVLGVVVDEQARAYPIRVLGLYEIINDRIGKQAVFATW